MHAESFRQYWVKNANSKIEVNLDTFNAAPNMYNDNVCVGDVASIVCKEIFNYRAAHTVIITGTVSVNVNGVYRTTFATSYHSQSRLNKPITETAQALRTSDGDNIVFYKMQ